MPSVSRIPRRSHFAVACAMALAAAFAGPGAASAATKDIVLDRVLAPSASTAGTDAMVLSVLIESPDGTLTPRSAETLFNTGDRFRIKVSASRDAKLSIYNTTPRGQLKAEPVWQGTVAAGQETITPRMVLTRESGAGTELLHFVLEPAAAPQGAFAWLTGWLAAVKPGSKDVRLDTQSTGAATYTLNPAGQGVVNTIRMVHR